MRVILTEDVKTLGTIGDILTVKDGYARNYLIPRSLAKVANESNKKELEHHKAVLDRRRQKVLAAMKELAAKIEKISVTVNKPVGEDERIFGAVTSAELEECLKKEGVEVSRKDIKLSEDIKKVGVYHGEVRLHSEVTAKFKIWVVAEATE
ncbi:MAG: 50S ribosomal protein L9 [Bdellovibrionota bacterium]